MKETLAFLIAHNTLNQPQAKDILLKIGQGEFSDPEIASFLTIFMMRKITPEELSGFRDALLELSVKVDINGSNVIDVCGTGGDEKNTFNISTLTSFVLAGAGFKVVKHGNYGVSSSVGSSNVLEHLGYTFSNDQDKLKRELDEANICYLHAPFFHPAMKHVANVRKSLKLRTFFNLLGPMVNPVRPVKQIVGVFNTEVQDLYRDVYKNLEADYFILHNLDGYDEISLTDNFRVISKVKEEILSPSDLMLEKINSIDLDGGATLEDSVRIFMNVLENKATKAQKNAVLANAIFGIKCFHPEKTFEECLSIAKESVESGSALQSLKTLINLQ